ncbi:cyclohexyl-isocyanide hydratase [Microbacterium keratanolyticum]|uniref:Dimethylglycine dehydrogenase n=1 Tax=Microbacterium keratanolyticum TaxID=67574 RepID=A0A9W6HU89_9MICO|nr:DJ-1/PfpI family protein [Microbacterium keratanolyticum]MBM7468036.1 cyclohexyl-isocyanide hydratase [Microbacterium keratanolyticum]GLK03027.1 dimethylglycine dehydrogenase [Microbacterium keratanolyticum]
MSSLRVVALLFPGVTQLDLTGPLQVLAVSGQLELHLAWRTLDPVPTDAGFSIVPTVTLADAPPADILFIPGGQGTFALLDDDEVLQFVRRQAEGARWVTSVCTGSFLLGAAGLLQGLRATTHWASLPLLASLGAIPTSERVVREGRVITGAGVSSGIDFALTLLAELFGEQEAKRVQLQIEYDPQPPFDAGSPRRRDADPQLVEMMTALMHERRAGVVERAAARLS